MNMDIETYPSIDIREAEVYVYVSAPDFEILLTGYRYGGQDVKVIDLTGPLVDPERDFLDFWEGLYSSDVIKTAYNTSFERICLVPQLDKPMPPEQWRCMVVHAATLGLPGTLGGMRETLGLPEDKQKDKIGKGLIQYFCKSCKPTKTNGMRNRNLSEYVPDEWQLFIEYNRQDVVAEATIREKLQIYPVARQEQELQNLDQYINDHGVRLDMDLVDKIVQYDGIHRERPKQEARKLTGLNNPSSLPQLRMRLFMTHGLDVPSITKDSIPVTEVQLKELKTVYDVLPGLKVLQIRKELGKTFVKKYQAMRYTVCPDGYLRGILQFYGANRTGRWAGCIVQVHNLPQNKIPDLDLAGDLVKQEDFDTLELLFEGVPFVFL